MLRNKLLWGSVRAIATGKRRNGISCHVDQAVQGVWTRWTLEVEREGRAVVFSLRALQRHAMVAKLIAGLNSLLSPAWHLWVRSWPGSTGIDGAADADASPNNCKLDLTWIFSVSYHHPLNETHKNNAKFSQNPTKTPNSNLLSWNHISVFSWGTLWNFNFLGKLLSLDVFWFRVQFCPTNLRNDYGNQLLSELLCK